MGIFSRRDKYGFDKNGMHKATGTKFNKDGFDKYGIHRNGTQLDENGFYVTGFNKDGLNKDGERPEGNGSYDVQSYTEPHTLDFENGIHKVTGTRYDVNGFDISGVHKVTGTKFDENGITNNKTQFDKYGIDQYGFGKDGFDRDGYNKDGFDKDGVNRETKVGFDINSCPPPKYPEIKKAYRQIGYNKDGFDENGFTTSGIHQTTGTKYDLDGNDQHGFDEKGIHKVTKTKFDEEGFDSDGIHKVTKTKFDEDGYDKDGHWEHDEILNILEETMALHTSSIKSLSYLDDREFTIIGVERKDHDENKGIKITTKEEFDIQGEKINKFHTTRQAIVRKFLNDAGEPTDLFNAINQPDNSLKVKIFMRKSASGRDYFDLEQC